MDQASKSFWAWCLSRLSSRDFPIVVWKEETTVLDSRHRQLRWTIRMSTSDYPRLACLSRSGVMAVHTRQLPRSTSNIWLKVQRWAKFQFYFFPEIKIWINNTRNWLAGHARMYPLGRPMHHILILRSRSSPALSLRWRTMGHRERGCFWAERSGFIPSNLAFASTGVT